MKQFNSEFAANEATIDLSLVPNVWAQVESASTKVSQTSRYHATTFSAKEYEAIELILNWPVDKIFPVLDFIRLMSLHPEAANHWLATNFLTKVIAVGLKKDGHAANAMLVFKFVANLFMLPSVRTKLFAFQEQLLENITDIWAASNKNTRLSLSTVLLNFSVLYLQEPNDQGISQALSVLGEALKATDNDEEVIFRLLVSLGTLVYHSKDTQGLARDLDLSDAIGGIKPTSDRVKLCIEELKTALKE